jgi:ABC-type transport system involved in cytochrome c biogenesis permease subunit
LTAGLAVIAAGLVTTWVVIRSGAPADGIQDNPWISWTALWNVLLLALGLVWAAMLFALIKVERNQVLLRNGLIGTVVLLGGLLAWLVIQGEAVQLGDSSMRILWQLVKGTVAALVLLAGCLMVFRKRAGIVLLHGGIGLMMFSELLVGVSAVEGNMTIQEGETANFVRDIRVLELAVVDTSDPEYDEMTVIPQSILLSGERISDEELPFDVEVVEFFQNVEVRALAPDEETPADRGIGRRLGVTRLRPSSGTDTGGAVDMSAAYVRFIDKETDVSLGTHLVGLFLSFQDLPETVTVGDKSYEVSLRFKRTYKSYAVTLADVRKDDYIGTNTPRNYSSDIHLVDESRGVDRDAHIWMNNPLRFAGETFYQSSYDPGGNGRPESTTLSVVTNTGWMIPYVSCMIVLWGMLYQFGLGLLRFLKRRADGAQTIPLSERSSAQVADELLKKKGQSARKHELPTPQPTVQSLWSSCLNILLPVVVVVGFGGWLIGKARVPKPASGAIHFYEFGKIPIVYQGRSKPIDTLARNSLRILSNMETYRDGNGNKRPAVRWLLDVIAKPQDAAKHKVFRIDHPELLELLELKRRKGYLYSFVEFGGKLQDLTKQAEAARKAGVKQASIYQKKVLELERKIGVVDMLLQSFSQPEIRPDHASQDLDRALMRQQLLARRHPPLAIPPDNDEQEWETYAAAWMSDLKRTVLTKEPSNPAFQSWTSMIIAYAGDKTDDFNEQVAKYAAARETKAPKDVDNTKINFEAFFNHFAPFYYSSVLYIASFLLAALAWLGWTKPLNRAAFWLVVFTFGVHTFALIARMYISGRPPVTNLYSSAVFIGWGTVLLGLILEVVYRLGIGNVIAAVTGFFALGIAHFLSGDGDTFVVLQAVLDTQFWLATHVVCITFGYATTFLAGMLGILYVIRGVFTPSLSARIGRDLGRMIYGILCFAIFFSFVGTVLGGLWADDSWGRFWGWDPKENGALIIVLWNALVLHARWGGMVKERGLAVLAIAGNIATSWSWFGVNELGVGLHSYGFTEGVLYALILFVLSQLVLIAIGSMPKHLWWSFRTR